MKEMIWYSDTAVLLTSQFRVRKTLDPGGIITLDQGHEALLYPRNSFHNGCIHFTNKYVYKILTIWRRPMRLCFLKAARPKVLELFLNARALERVW